MAVLDELWNIDKHRHLVLAEYWVSLENVVSAMERFYNGATLVDEAGQPYQFPPGHFDGHVFTIITKRPPGPFVDGAELGRAVESGSIFTLAREVYVDAELSRDLSFETGAPAYGGKVLETLHRIEDTVRSVVESFRIHL